MNSIRQRQTGDGCTGTLWELGIPFHPGIAIRIIPVLAIYKPLENKYFDRMVQKNRTSIWGNRFPMDKIARKLIEYHRRTTPVLNSFSWPTSDPCITRFNTGPNSWAGYSHFTWEQKNWPGNWMLRWCFLKIRKKRGRYEVEAELICESPESMEPYEITKHM